MINQMLINTSKMALKPIAADIMGIANIPPPIVVPATMSMLPKNLFFKIISVSGLK